MDSVAKRTRRLAGLFRLVPLLGAALGACDVTLSDGTSLGHHCDATRTCGSGERCLPSPAGMTCQLPSAHAGADSGAGDATLDTGEGLEAGQPDVRSSIGADATVTSQSDADAENDADASDDGDAIDEGDGAPPVPIAACDGGTPSMLVLFGGNGARGYYSDTWIWDGGAWAPAGDGGPAMRDQATLVTRCGVGVLAGGQNGRSIENDVWLWNGTGWQPGPRLPEERYGAGAGVLGSTLVLFGGWVPGTTSDTDPSLLLAFDGGTWSALPSGDAGPDPRVNPAFAVTPDGLLLFGGEGSEDFLADTWLWTGTSWTLVDDGGADGGPGPLTEASMVAWGSSALLFGGQALTGQGTGDTWLWTGTHWSKAAGPDAGPSGRYGAAMANLNGQVVLFGGLDNDSLPRADTWVWDGGWTQVSDAGPPPRSNPAMTPF